jgi:glucosylceramidase
MNKIILSGLSILLLLGSSISIRAQKRGQVTVFQTLYDSTELFQQKKSITINKNDVSAKTVIEIDLSRKFQKINGFGSSMTGSSAYVFNKYLSPERRKRVYEDLFDSHKGIGISYMRMNIGASDFSSHNYSYDDLPDGVVNDPDMKYFSIQEDTKDLIPAIQEILAINPRIEIMGSPWSAPAWMKTSGSMIKGKLKPEAQGAFANYFVKYIQEFDKQNIPIKAITIQNEPEFEPDGYPGMRMDAGEQRDFIKNFLGPAFIRQNINTKIVVFDHNWNNPQFPNTILNDPDAKKYVAGSAFHCYAGEVDAQSIVHNAHPDKEIYFTECSGGGWSGSFAENLSWDFRNLIIGNLRNWTTTVLFWNLALDEKSGPVNGGCMNCRGIVTVKSTGEVVHNIEYYVLAHVSKFVRPGAHRVFSTDTKTSGLYNVAFENTDGSKVLIIQNDTKESQTFNVKCNKQVFHYNLPAEAVATLIWK